MAAMSLPTVQIVIALVASVVLLLQIPAKLFPALALLASGLEALLVFRIVQFSIRGVDLWLVLGAVLVVAAAIVWARNDNKLGVTAATAVALVGAMQVMGAIA